MVNEVDGGGEPNRHQQLLESPALNIILQFFSPSWKSGLFGAMVYNNYIIMGLVKVLFCAFFLLSVSAKLSLTDFGHLASVQETDDVIHKEITLTNQNVYNSYAERYRYIKEAET